MMTSFFIGTIPLILSLAVLFGGFAYLYHQNERRMLGEKTAIKTLFNWIAKQLGRRYRDYELGLDFPGMANIKMPFAESYAAQAEGQKSRAQSIISSRRFRNRPSSAGADTLMPVDKILDSAHREITDGN